MPQKHPAETQAEQVPAFTNLMFYNKGERDTQHRSQCPDLNLPTSPPLKAQSRLEYQGQDSTCRREEDTESLHYAFSCYRVAAVKFKFGVSAFPSRKGIREREERESKGNSGCVFACPHLSLRKTEPSPPKSHWAQLTLTPSTHGERPAATESRASAPSRSGAGILVGEPDSPGSGTRSSAPDGLPLKS